MIVMLISDAPEIERKALLKYARRSATRFTDEYWKWLECGSVRELEELAEEGTRADLLCIDITMAGALDVVKTLRASLPDSYLILIANAKIRPTDYMRPTIGAESLLLKPLGRDAVEEVLDEAVSHYTARFQEPDEGKYFVAENNGSRDLIAFGRILYFEAREKKVFACTESEEYGFYDTLDRLEEQLEGRFLRCHRGFLINQEKVRRVMLSAGSITLEGEFSVPLSRSYKQSVKCFLVRRQDDVNDQ